MVRASGKDAFWTPPLGGVSGLSNREETSGPPQDTLEGLHHPADLGTPRGSLGRADGSGWGEDCLGFLAEAAAPATRTRISGGRRVRVRVKTTIPKKWLFHYIL